MPKAEPMTRPPKMKHTCISFPPSTLAELRDRAKANEISLAELIRRAVDFYIRIGEC